MTAETSGAIVLAWQPEVADYLETFRARNRERNSPLKIGVMLGFLFVVGLVGIASRRPELAGAGWGGLVGAALVLGPGQRLKAWSFWRRATVLRDPVRVTLVPGVGLTSAVTGITGQYGWEKFPDVLEADRVFILEMEGGRRRQCMVLAKRGLPPGVDVATLRDLLLRETANATSARSRVEINPPPAESSTSA